MFIKGALYPVIYLLLSIFVQNLNFKYVHIHTYKETPSLGRSVESRTPLDKFFYLLFYCVGLYAHI